MSWCTRCSATGSAAPWSPNWTPPERWPSAPGGVPPSCSGGGHDFVSHCTEGDAYSNFFTACAM